MSQPFAAPSVPSTSARSMPISEAITHSRQAAARSRLALELRAIAMDLLGLYQTEELPHDCAAWVRTTIETAVTGISDPMVATITRRLGIELRAAPADIARQVDLARRRHEIGFR